MMNDSLESRAYSTDTVAHHSTEKRSNFFGLEFLIFPILFGGFLLALSSPYWWDYRHSMQRSSYNPTSSAHVSSVSSDQPIYQDSKIEELQEKYNST